MKTDLANKINQEEKYLSKSETDTLRANIHENRALSKAIIVVDPHTGKKVVVGICF